MLILSRKVNEVVVIELPNGESMRVAVCLIRDDRVRLGFTAPLSISINRQEVLDRIAERRADAGCPVAGAWRDEAMEGGGGGE